MLKHVSATYFTVIQMLLKLLLLVESTSTKHVLAQFIGTNCLQVFVNYEQQC
jgi:hypothetical protein